MKDLKAQVEALEKRRAFWAAESLSYIKKNNQLEEALKRSRAHRDELEKRLQVMEDELRRANELYHAHKRLNQERDLNDHLARINRRLKAEAEDAKHTDAQKRVGYAPL